MTHPTKEEVTSIRNCAEANYCLPSEVVLVCDAYLALREEVEELEWKAKSLCVELGNAFMEKTKLQAENEALRERLTQVEQASQRIIGNIIGEQTHGTY